MAKNKQQKKKERERRVAKKKLAATAKRREQEKTTKESQTTLPERTKHEKGVSAKASHVQTSKKNTFTQRRSGG